MSTLEEIPSWLKADRQRNRQFLKRRKRARVSRELILKAVFYTILVTLLLGVYLTVEAVDKWTDELINIQPVEAQVFELEVVEEVNNEVVMATITAYTSSVDETDDTPFITASGARTGNGVVACPPKYGFGTQIEIQGQVFVCEDRMNRRYHDQERFDIWVETKTEAFNWGVKKLPIIILKMV